MNKLYLILLPYAPELWSKCSRILEIFHQLIGFCSLSLFSCSSENETTAEKIKEDPSVFDVTRDLLKGINDSTDALEELLNEFAHLGIRPYYLHHPDKVQGGTHFQLDIEQGRKIYASLRTKVPGWLLPTYILDIPNGEGKTPIYNPESIDFSGKVINLNQELISL